MKTGANVISNQSGFTLTELVVLIVIMGVLLPATFGLMKELSTKNVRNEIIVQSVSLANAKMEEILAFRRENPADWDDNIADYAGTESLTNGYSRTVSITPINNWGTYNLTVYQVQTSISHDLLDNDLTLTMMVAKY